MRSAVWLNSMKRRNLTRKIYIIAVKENIHNSIIKEKKNVKATEQNETV